MKKDMILNRYRKKAIGFAYVIHFKGNDIKVTTHLYDTSDFDLLKENQRNLYSYYIKSLIDIFNAKPFTYWVGNTFVTPNKNL